MENNFTIKFIPGVLNILPDALSRLYPVQARAPALSASLNVLQLMPEDPTLLKEPPQTERSGILTQAHDFGHLGAKAVVDRVYEMGHHWSSLKRDVEDHVKACVNCQRFSVARRGFHPLTNVVANAPMVHVGVDLAGPLPETPSRNIFILVLICLFTRFFIL